LSHVPRILVDLPLTEGSVCTLPADKAHHVATVLRLGRGASLRLFNGDGHECRAVITHAERRQVEIRVDAVTTPPVESPLELTLVQGIARGDRMDFAIAKAVELGVHTVQPAFTARGKVKLEGRRLEKKQAHWQRVAESAAEQSGRLAWPRVQPAANLADLLAAPATNAAVRLLLAPGAATRLRKLAPTSRITLFVGPESGFSAAELERAEAAGIRTLDLGPRILRTETAGMAALAAIQSHWGDLG